MPATAFRSAAEVAAIKAADSNRLRDAMLLALAAYEDAVDDNAPAAEKKAKRDAYKAARKAWTAAQRGV